MTSFHSCQAQNYQRSKDNKKFSLQADSLRLQVHLIAAVNCVHPGPQRENSADARFVLGSLGLIFNNSQYWKTLVTFFMLG